MNEKVAINRVNKINNSLTYQLKLEGRMKATVILNKFKQETKIPQNEMISNHHYSLMKIQMHIFKTKFRKQSICQRNDGFFQILNSRMTAKDI